MPRKPLTRTQLVKKTDKVFSRLIRVKGSVPDGRYEGGRYCVCITCNKKVSIKKIHAGHYIRRGVMPVRWNHYNVHPQCAGCNTYNYGEPTLYRMYLVRQYGEHIAKELDEELVKWKQGKVEAMNMKDLRDQLEKFEKDLKRYEEAIA